jgi:membrane protease YdiL (CAAX protease family)
MRRVRPALAEIALAFAGMLLGLALLAVLGELGLLPSAGALGESVGFVIGPAVTATGAAFYAWGSRHLDLFSGARADSSAPRVSLAEALVWTAVGLAAALAGSWLLGELMTRLEFPVAEQRRILEITRAARRGEATLQLWMLAGSAVVLAPLAEEWMFRGLLFRRIHARAGLPIAFVCSSLAFAAIHANLAGFVIYTWLGLVFAETLRRTGRLWTAIVVHMGNNAFALSLLLIAPPSS